METGLNVGDAYGASIKRWKIMLCGRREDFWHAPLSGRSKILFRKILVDNYGMYASGEKKFGEKIYMKYDATPENYNVYIELDNGEVYSDTIDVRNDPIKSN